MSSKSSSPTHHTFASPSFLLFIFVSFFLSCIPVWFFTSRVIHEELPTLSTSLNSDYAFLYERALTVNVWSLSLTSTQTSPPLISSDQLLQLQSKLSRAVNAPVQSPPTSESNSTLDSFPSQVRLTITLQTQSPSVQDTAQLDKLYQIQKQIKELFTHQNKKKPAPRDVDNLLQSWLANYHEVQTNSVSTHSNTQTTKLPALDIFVLDCSECTLPQSWSSSAPSSSSSTSSSISTLFFGARRHGWVFVDSQKPQYQTETAQLMRQLHDSLLEIAKKHQSLSADSLIMRFGSGVGGWSGSLRLSFTLLNAQPSGKSNWVDWDFQAIYHNYLSRFLSRVSSVIRLSVDSQVRHYGLLSPSTELNATKTTHTFDTEELLDQFQYIYNLPSTTSQHANLTSLPKKKKVAKLPASSASPTAASTPNQNTEPAATDSEVTAASETENTPVSYTSSFYSLPLSSLRNFVGSTRWNNISPLQRASIEFLLYVPPPEVRPLLLEDDTQAKQKKQRSPKEYVTSFMVPRWGGVAILNDIPSPPAKRSTFFTDEFGQGLEEEEVLPGLKGRVMLNETSILPAMSTFLAQIRTTLGLSKDMKQMRDSGYLLLDSALFGVSEWEMDILLSRNVLESGRAALNNIASLYSLLEKVPHMPVEKSIQSRVHRAMEQLERIKAQISQASQALSASSTSYSPYPSVIASRNVTDSLVTTGVSAWQDASRAARRSLRAAQSAFFHHEMVPLLYFPTEHLYAVYAPLFIPILLPVLVAVLKFISKKKK